MRSSQWLCDGCMRNDLEPVLGVKCVHVALN